MVSAFDNLAMKMKPVGFLLGVGVTFLLIGLIMVMVNRILGAQEDEELKSYVSSRLARTRSGHVLCRNRDVSIDFTKLAPPGPGTSSRRSSYRDRAGSSRSINRSTIPSTKPNQNTVKGMERSNTVRRSIKKASPSQSLSSTTGPVALSNISRSNSQRISKGNQEAKTSLHRSSTKEEFRGRTSSLKNGNLPTVLVRVTDETNNSSSLVLLGPGAGTGSGMRSISNHSSVGCDDDTGDLLKSTERDNLLPKGEIQRVSSSSLSYQTRKPSKKKAKDGSSASGSPASILSSRETNQHSSINTTERVENSNQQTSTSKFNSDRTMSTTTKTRTSSES
jgi:hypothetical protein